MTPAERTEVMAGCSILLFTVVVFVLSAFLVALWLSMVGFFMGMMP